MVINSAAKGNLQALLELREENHPREQSSYGHWNPDRGSRNQVPGGREFVGDYGADGDDDDCDLGDLTGNEKNFLGNFSKRYLCLKNSGSGREQSMLCLIKFRLWRNKYDYPFTTSREKNSITI